MELGQRAPLASNFSSAEMRGIYWVGAKVDHSWSFAWCPTRSTRGIVATARWAGPGGLAVGGGR